MTNRVGDNGNGNGEQSRKNSLDDMHSHRGRIPPHDKRDKDMPSVDLDFAEVIAK